MGWKGKRREGEQGLVGGTAFLPRAPTLCNGLCWGRRKEGGGGEEKGGKGTGVRRRLYLSFNVVFLWRPSRRRETERKREKRAEALEPLAGIIKIQLGKGEGGKGEPKCRWYYSVLSRPFYRLIERRKKGGGERRAWLLTLLSVLLRRCP